MKTTAAISRLSAALCLFGFSLAAESITKAKPEPKCVDHVVAKALIEPKLDSDFFRSKESSYPFHIIEHEDGHLENTMGGKVSRKEATKIEHTAKCSSSHQGEHLMSYCDAQQSDGGLLLFVTGGLPAYASTLTLKIDKENNLKCWFEAVYPMTIPGEKLDWKITNKKFRMKSDDFKGGVRLLGWLSVEFEETCTIDGKVTRHTHKIEGYVKPIIRKADPHPDARSEQGAPDRPPPAPPFQ
jgi:hypothetical protein